MNDLSVSVWVCFGFLGFTPLLKNMLVSGWTKINCPLGVNVCALFTAKDWRPIQGVFLPHALFPGISSGMSTALIRVKCLLKVIE